MEFVYACNYLAIPALPASPGPPCGLCCPPTDSPRASPTPSC